MSELDPDLLQRAINVEKARARRSLVFGFIIIAIAVTPVGYVIARLQGYEGRERWIAAALVSVGLLIAGGIAVKAMQWLASDVFLAFLQPGGDARGASNTSRAEALAAAGLVEQATAEFDAARATDGDRIPALRVEAELHATAQGDPKRAEALFTRIRRSPNATRTDELYASHRLIDLYIGPLQDQGRAMVELRRMADRFPDTIDGQGALAELNRRKAEVE